MEPETPTAKDVRRLEVAQLLAAGRTQAQIRELTGMSERSIRRLQSEEPFRLLVHQARRKRADEINRRVPAILEEAMDVLTDIMRNSESDATRLGAVKTVMALSTRLDAEEFADRLVRLEQAVMSEAGWAPDPLPDEGLYGDADE